MNAQTTTKENLVIYNYIRTNGRKIQIYQIKNQKKLIFSYYTIHLPRVNVHLRFASTSWYIKEDRVYDRKLFFFFSFYIL